MSANHPVSFVESLESRAYAASNERVTIAMDDPNHSAVVRQFAVGTRPTLERVSVSIDENRIIRIVGGYGDDSVRVQAVTGGVEIRTYTRESYRYFGASKYSPKAATATIENRYRFAETDYQRLTFAGGKGSDSVRFAGLSFVPIVDSVETITPQTYAEAPAGQTPSDAIRGGRWRAGSGWANEVAKQLDRANLTAADTAFVGDSHVSNFLTIGHKFWHRSFRRAASFGIGGDSTRQLLARIQGGLFDTYKPANVVVSIGTNNFNNPATSGTDEQVYQGVLSVVAAIRAKLPTAKIVLIGLLPRTGAGVGERIQTLNDRLAKTDEDNGFTYLDVYSRFNTGPDYGMVALLSPDSHYTPRGYQILAYHIQDILA